jgi:type VI secretion system FHA domain protein
MDEPEATACLQMSPSNTDDAALLEAFCRGMGLPPAVFTRVDAADVIERAGQCLAVCLQGMQAVMGQRAQMKSEFRIEQTRVSATHNNPVKVSVNQRQLLRHLLKPDLDTCIPLTEALSACFAELQQHQDGLLAGLEGALHRLLDKLDPDALESRFESVRARTIAIGSRKALYWDAYRQLHRALKEEEEAFFYLYGDSFGKAYRQKMGQVEPPSVQP